MTTKLTLLLLAVIAASAVAARALLPVTGNAPTPVATKPAAENLDTEVVPMPEPALADDAETEVVMGIEVRKDRNCIVERHYVDLGDGNVTEAFRCVPTSPAAGEYAHYSNEELRVLAYGDARAAGVLGKRLADIDPRRAEALLLRAVALQPDNVAPVMWLVAHSHSLRGESQEAQRARAYTYVLTRTVQALGSDADIAWVLRDLRRAGFTLEDVARLDSEVRKNLRRIRDIQLEVLGETTIDEVQL